MHPYRHAQGQAHQERRQTQLEGGRNAFQDHTQHRPLGEEGATKIAAQHAEARTGRLRLAIAIRIQGNEHRMIGDPVAIRVPAHPIVTRQPAQVLDGPRIIDAQARGQFFTLLGRNLGIAKKQGRHRATRRGRHEQV